MSNLEELRKMQEPFLDRKELLESIYNERKKKHPSEKKYQLRKNQKKKFLKPDKVDKRAVVVKRRPKSANKLSKLQQFGEEEKKAFKPNFLRHDFKMNMARIKSRLKASQKINSLNIKLGEVLRELNSFDRRTNFEIATNIGFNDLSLYVNSNQSIPFNNLVTETKKKSTDIIENLKKCNYNKNKVLGELQKWFNKIYEEREDNEYFLKHQNLTKKLENYSCEGLVNDFKDKTIKLKTIKYGFDEAFNKMKHELIKQKNLEIESERKDKSEVIKSKNVLMESMKVMENNLAKAIEKYREIDTRNKVLERMLENMNKTKENQVNKLRNEKINLLEEIKGLKEKVVKQEKEMNEKTTQMKKMEKFSNYIVTERENVFSAKIKENSDKKDVLISKLQTSNKNLQEEIDENKKFTESILNQNENLREEIRKMKENGVKVVEKEKEEVEKKEQNNVETQTVKPSISKKIRKRQKIVNSLDLFLSECKKMIFQVQFSNSVTFEKILKILLQKIPVDIENLIKKICLENNFNPSRYFAQYEQISVEHEKKIRKLEHDQKDKFQDLVNDKRIAELQDSIIDHTSKSMFEEEMFSGHFGKEEDEKVRKFFVNQLLKEKERLKSTITQQMEKIYKLRNMFYDNTQKVRIGGGQGGTKENRLKHVSTREGIQLMDEVRKPEVVSFGMMRKRIPMVDAKIQTIENPFPVSTNAEISPDEIMIPVPEGHSGDDNGKPALIDVVIPPLNLSKADSREELFGSGNLSGENSPSSPTRAVFQKSVMGGFDNHQPKRTFSVIEMFFKNLEQKLLEDENQHFREKIIKLKEVLGEKDVTIEKFIKEKLAMKKEITELKNEIEEEKEFREKREKKLIESMFKEQGGNQNGKGGPNVFGGRGKGGSALGNISDPKKLEDLLDELEFSRSANEYILNKVEELTTDALESYNSIAIIPVSELDFDMSFLEGRPDHDLVCIQLREIFQRVSVLYYSVKKFTSVLHGKNRDLYRKYTKLKQDEKNRKKFEKMAEKRRKTKESREYVPKKPDHSSTTMKRILEKEKRERMEKDKKERKEMAKKRELIRQNTLNTIRERDRKSREKREFMKRERERKELEKKREMVRQNTMKEIKRRREVKSRDGGKSPTKKGRPKVKRGNTVKNIDLKMSFEKGKKPGSGHGVVTKEKKLFPAIEKVKKSEGVVVVEKERKKEEDVSKLFVGVQKPPKTRKQSQPKKKKRFDYDVFKESENEDTDDEEDDYFNDFDKEVLREQGMATSPMSKNMEEDSEDDEEEIEFETERKRLVVRPPQTPKFPISHSFSHSPLTPSSRKSTAYSRAPPSRGLIRTGGDGSYRLTRRHSLENFDFKTPLVGRNLVTKSYDIVKIDTEMKAEKVGATFRMFLEKLKLVKLQAELYSLKISSGKPSKVIIMQITKLKELQERKYNFWKKKRKRVIKKKNKNLERGLYALQHYVYLSIDKRDIKKSNDNFSNIYTISYGKNNQRKVIKSQVKFPDTVRKVYNNSGRVFRPPRSPSNKDEAKLPDILRNMKNVNDSKF